MKKVFLVDVSNLYFRAFYAIRQLNNSKGFPTNALYGFISMTIKFLREMKPDYIAYCYDRKEPSFRAEIDSNYKAHRTEMPDDLQKQMPFIPQIVDALGIPSFSVANFEADDVIGTLANYVCEQGCKAVIVSGDKDFGQVVNHCIEVYDPMKDIHYDEIGIFDKLGVKPEQVVDYLAIVGDTSDNIPGVGGIGPKGAQKLLAQYGTLESIYEHIDEVKPEGVRKKLIADKEAAFLSKKLSKIVTDVPMELSLEALKIKPLDREKLLAILQELEFKQFEKTLLGEVSSTSPAAASPTAPVVQEKREVIVVRERKTITERAITAVELEAAIPREATLWSLHTSRGTAVGFQNQCLLLQDDPEKVGRVLDGKKIFWKGYDLKEFWKTFNLNRPTCTWDHMIAAYVIRAGPIGHFEEIYKKYLEPLPELPSFAQLYQANLDLEVALHNKLNSQNGVSIYERLELPLITVLYEMERFGVLIDPNELSLQSQQLKKEIQKLEEDIFEYTKEVFNLGSPKQLARILFEKLKMPPGRRTKTGFSTDSDVLERLAIDYPICKKIIEHRELMKLKSTYIDALPQLINSKTGRLHTHFNQAVTTTGRLSSTNPNLQNIPIRTDRGNAIRKAFVADPGCCIISADYSQIELRILAHISKDKNLIKAFNDDLDIHSATAAEVFGVGLKEVTSDLRRTAKAVNFGIAYGMGAFGLAENLGISRTEAAEVIKKYFIKFPGVKDYMTSIVETAKKQGYVETLYGRRRYIDELYSKNHGVKQFGERAAINAPMQGTASDIVKKAMIDLVGQTKGKMVMQVHDELVFESEESISKEECAIIKPIMESALKLDVPLKVGIGVGKNWESAH